MVILFDQYNLPENIFEVIFSTNQQVVVANMLLEEMKLRGGKIGKTEMSMFATALHDGIVIEPNDNAPLSVRKKPVTISYNKRQFYDRILTPMKTMGMIDYDMYKKTYKVSEKLNKNLMRIGLMWLQELRRPPKAFTIKKPDTKT
jgi:hypothetical protein